MWLLWSEDEVIRYRTALDSFPELGAKIGGTDAPLYCRPVRNLVATACCTSYIFTLRVCEKEYARLSRFAP